MKVGLDVDGVLANFESGFLPLLSPATQKRVEQTVQLFPPVWDWPEYYGATTEEVAVAWVKLKIDSSFWERLQPLGNAEQDLRRLSNNRYRADIYFVTHRMGLQPKHQTEIWLAKHGYPCPTVLVSPSKAIVSGVLGLDAFIDDKPDTIQRWPAIPTRLFVYDRPYNRDVNSGVTRVKTVGQMLDKLGL